MEDFASAVIGYPKGIGSFSPGLGAVSSSNGDLPWEINITNVTTLKGLELMEQPTPPRQQQANFDNPRVPPMNREFDPRPL
jgi:hypothetical protein